MNTLRKIPSTLVLYPFLSLALMLAAFVPAVRPHHATAGSFEPARQADWSRALPNWWSITAFRPAPREYLLADAITRVQIESPIGTEIIAQTLDADAKPTFHAVGYSNGAGSSQVVTWTLSADVGSLSPIRGVTTTLDAGSVGTALLTATLVTTPTISATARITVTPGVAAWLSLSPASDTITAGESVVYMAVAYDQDDNQVGDVTASTTFTIDAAAGGTWADEEYTSEKSGEWTVVGSHTNAADSEVTGTAALTVSPADLDHIRINSAANNGAEVVSHTLNIYEQFTVWAGCYDQFDNYCGDVEADWEATGVLAQGGLAPNPATSTTFTPAPILSGTGSIVATFYGDQTDSTGLITVTAPWLVISKTDLNDPVAPGGILRYTLRYTNAGNAPAPSVVVTETYDQRVTYAYANPTPVNPGKNVWVLDGIDPGESNDFLFLVEVEVADTLEPGAVLTNIVAVGGPRLDAYSVTETTTITSTTALNPELWLWVNNGRSSVRAGERITYALSYINAGNKDAQDTTIAATPPPTQYISDIECRPSSICDASGTPVEYDLGTVHSGDTDTVELIVTVEDPLPAGARDFVVAASIDTSTPGDPTQGNNAQDVDDIATHPDLQVNVDYHTLSPYPGKRLTYTLYYSNTGHIATTGVVVTATPPRYTTYDAGASSAWINRGDGDYIYIVEELGYNQSGSLTFVVTLPSPTFTTTMPNFDTAFGIYDDGGSGADDNPENNVALAPLGLPDLIVEAVEVNWWTLYSHEPGNHVTVTVKNIGTNVACNTLPPPTSTQEYCAGFLIDLYINPDKPPVSFPTGRPIGDTFTDQTLAVNPGESQSYAIGESYALPADKKPPLFLYIFVDNYEEATRPYGLVAEYNELNNVFGPVTLRSENTVYLPLTLRSD